MKRNRFLFIVCFTVSCTVNVYAQVSVPPMDIQLKSGYAWMDDIRDLSGDHYSYRSPLISAELNWNFTKHFSVGGYLTKGVQSHIQFDADISKASKSYESGYQSYGLKIRYATDRTHRFRPFGELTYGKFEMYMEKDAYRFSCSGGTFGFSFGLMVRLRTNLYLILPQFDYHVRSDQFVFEKADNFLFSKYPGIVELKGGLAYNFGKKK